MMVLIELNPSLKIINVEANHSELFELMVSDLIGLDFTIVLEKINTNIVILFYDWANQEKKSLHFTYEYLLHSGECLTIDAFRMHDKFCLFVTVNSKLDVKTTFEKKFKSLLMDHFSGGVLFLDTNGLVLDCTEGTLHLFKLKNMNKVQLTREAIIDKSFLNLLEINNQLEITGIMKSMMEKSKDEFNGVLSEDINIHDKVCQFFIASLYLQNQHIGYYIFAHDLTILREKDKLIESQLASLTSASKLAALGAMAGGIAHEINNPITIINSNARLIRKYIEKGIVDPVKIYKACDDIDKTVERISKIISGLRTVSRDSSDEELAPCKLLSVFEDVLALSDEKFKTNKIAIDIDLNNETFQTIIPCRRVQLSQVFLNLLGNSFDAIEFLEERWVKINCILIEDNIVIRFIDSGLGIDKEIQDKILNPFFTTKEIGKGTGLGLSLSYSFIKSHNGTLEIDNNSKNTCFMITLPTKGDSRA
ncbi:MAG: ATP-binding protein [Bacteriovorax sp.]|nr:ATP-binding protein [Bacteriovorax sp.]